MSAFRRVLLIAPLLGLCGACQSDPPTQAAIRIRLDTESIDSGCMSSVCEDYSMTCGAMVMLRITDPKTGEVLLRDNVEPLSLCLQAPSSEDLCGIKTMDMRLFGIPAKNVRVEVALFNPDDKIAGQCPSPNGFELFDRLGRPQTNSKLPLAFAGSANFQAGEDSEVVVPLFCPNPEVLSVDTCTANLPTDVRAVVTDIDSMQTLRKEQAPTITVEVGEARSVPDNLGTSDFVLEAADTEALALNNLGAVPVFEDSIGKRFGDLVCSTTLEGVPQATVSARCEQVPFQAPDLELQPILIHKELVDAALLALGETSFPDAGIVIGRVVDESFSPSAGVAVTPDSGSVLYLDDDLAASPLGLTSNSAYFVATDVPFGSTWTASHFDGRRQSGTPRAGLIEGKVSTLIIRLTGDVIGE